MKVIDPEFVPREMMVIFLKYVAQATMAVVFNLMVDIIDFFFDIHDVGIGLIRLIFHFLLLQHVDLGGVVLEFEVYFLLGEGLDVFEIFVRADMLHFFIEIFLFDF